MQDQIPLTGTQLNQCFYGINMSIQITRKVETGVLHIRRCQFGTGTNVCGGEGNIDETKLTYVLRGRNI